MSEKINEEEIRFLSPRDACRRRTGMYLGSTENANITIREIIDNSCDEISSGYGDTILISNNFNGYCFVADNGRGLPISMSIDKPDITAAELSITEFHSGSKFDGTDTIARVGMNGIGSSAVNFTSSVYIILSKITENNYNRSIPAVNQAWCESGPRVRKELYYILVMNEGLKVYEGAGRLGDLEKEIFKDCPGYISLPEGQSTIVLFKPDPTIFENINVEIPLSNLQYFLLIQEKFYKKRVNVIVNGENIRSSFKPYQFEITETIIPKDTTYNKQVGIYITFEADPTLGNVVSAGSVNGLTCDDGCHMSLVKNLYKSALKDYFKVKHDYLLNGFKFVCIVLANECQFNSQTKENLKQITKVKTTDFDDVVKDFQKIFKKNEDYWTEHVGKLNYLAESMKSLSAIDKAQKIIDDAGGRGIYKLKGEIANGFADATASDRWNCNLFLCFTGDTEIMTSDEDISFVDLVRRIKSGEDIWTYSCKPTGELISAKIIAADKIKSTNRLCKVTLDNGEEIKCTPDHEMMLANGSYKTAIDLVPGDSMMSLSYSTDIHYKVDSVEIICLDVPEDVYCLEVDTPEHNFPLAAGVFTKNCEGLSAAGSLKKGRKDTRYNAVMPLRGKVKNVKDSSADQAMDNKELFTIFKLIGLGIDVNNVTKDAKTPEEAYELIQRYTRFSKIVIATDADEDGYAIRNGLCYAFLKFARFIIDFGLLYVIESPIFEQNGVFYYPSDPVIPGTPFRVGMDPNKHYRRFKGLLKIVLVYRNVYCIIVLKAGNSCQVCSTRRVVNFSKNLHNRDNPQFVRVRFYKLQRLSRKRVGW